MSRDVDVRSLIADCEDDLQPLFNDYTPQGKYRHLTKTTRRSRTGARKHFVTEHEQPVIFAPELCDHEVNRNPPFSEGRSCSASRGSV
jgi:hypothetical protein